jgi:hypothetical protein
MSWLSALGKIGKGVLNIGTGGIAGTILDAAGDLGSVAGKQAQGNTNDKITQAQLLQGQDRNAIDLYQAQQGAQNQARTLDLQTKDFENQNRGKTAQQALVAALLNGGLPATSIAGGKASGGLAEKLRTDPDAMAAMRNLHGQADKAQMAVPNFAGGQLLNAPTLSAAPKIDSGGWLSKLASIGQFAGALGSNLPGQQASIPYLSPAQPGLPSNVPGQVVPPLAIPKKHIVEDLDGDGSNRG